MAISRMQEPRQLYGLGSFVKKAVKKATRGVKKIAKSPIGKAALIGGLGMYGMGAGPFSGVKGAGFLGRAGSGLGSLFGKAQAAASLRGPAEYGMSTRSGLLGKLGKFAGTLNPFGDTFSGKNAFLTAGAGLVAAPFLMNAFAPEEEVEEEVDVMDIAGIRKRAQDFYRGATDTGLNFMPQKQYVQPNFYAAAGGRAMLSMGGAPGGQQAEQMLMTEFIKYKNKGGTLSFEQFVKAIMQASQQPEGAGMEQPQPVAMAANGGRIGYNDIPREGYESGQRVTGILKLLSMLTPAGAAKKAGESLANMDADTLKKLSMFTPVGAARKAGESLAGMDMDILKKLSMFTPAGAAVQLGKKFALKDGGRTGKQEGGIMDAEASEMIDMGGMEKDYRETGGFVEMGGKERADDVPARLSKNEFVFTADAVRNAGGGDIDKGAEVMENLMNNLEQGGKVSEDSQGLEGAQAMYDQQQMLQSRIA
jgi:hypothetical protein